MARHPRPIEAKAFDFLIARRWTIASRYLTESGDESPVWTECRGTLEGWFLLGGLGNVDSYYSDTHPCWRSTLRLFDPDDGVWTIYQTDSLNPRLSFEARGGFADGRGTFYGRRIVGARELETRCVWKDITDHSALYERASRSSAHQDWNTDWVMHLSAARDGL